MTEQETQQESAAPEVLCPGCKAPNDPSSRFCLKCGRPLDREEAAALPVQDSTEASTSHPERPLTLPPNAKRALLIIVAALAAIAILAVGITKGCARDNESASESDSGTGIQFQAPDTIQWPTSGLGALLPTPESPFGDVREDTDEAFRATVEGTTQNDFDAYIDLCIANGFTEDASRERGRYQAENPDGCRLTLTLDSDSNKMDIVVLEPAFMVTVRVDCVANWFFSTYDIAVYVDGEMLGVIDHGGEASYQLELKGGAHTLTIENEQDSQVDGSVEIEVSEDSELAFRVYCHNGNVNIEPIAEDEANENSGSDDEPEASEEAPSGSASASASSTPSTSSSSSQSSGSNSSASSSSPSSADAEPEVLTVDNCEDLATLLSSDDYDFSRSFASTYKGRTIEFDGSIDYWTYHGSFTTRFDFLLSGGNYSESSQTGPTFKFEDVNRSDLNLPSSVSGLSVGDNVRITAEVVKFDYDRGIFYLEPVKVTLR